MFQNYEIIFGIGAFGVIISFILLLIAVIKNVKRLKIISIILISIFVVVFSMGIALRYYYYENSKNAMDQANDDKLHIKIKSGSIEDPVVIKEKTFFVDDTYYYSEFEITNNTNVEISKISFHILFTYNGKMEDEHIFLLDSIIPPNKTIVENYIWKKGQKLSSSNVKLTKIQDLICYVNINGEEKGIKLDDLKATLKNNK